jgi:mycoredoxin-dependent peroxiredoxin
VTIPLGAEAPDFELRDQHGRPVRLSSYRGDKVVALVFYPYAFTRVCSGELATLRDRMPDFESDTVQLLAISCDPMFTLRAFAEREGLEFPLLSDFWPHGQVASAYDVFDADRGHARRSTVVVDRAGAVRWTVDNEIGEARDEADLVAVVTDITEKWDGSM